MLQLAHGVIYITYLNIFQYYFIYFIFTKALREPAILGAVQLVEKELEELCHCSRIRLGMLKSDKGIFIIVSLFYH